MHSIVIGLFTIVTMTTWLLKLNSCGSINENNELFTQQSDIDFANYCKMNLINLLGQAFLLQPTKYCCRSFFVFIIALQCSLICITRTATAL